MRAFGEMRSGSPCRSSRTSSSTTGSRSPASGGRRQGPDQPGEHRHPRAVPDGGRQGRPRERALRIGVNSGSLEADLLAEHGGPTPAALVESARRAVALAEAVGFRNRGLAQGLERPGDHRGLPAFAAGSDVPLHLGVTEAGGALRGDQVGGRPWAAARRRDRRHPARLADRRRRWRGARRLRDPRRARAAPQGASRSSPARPAAAAASTSAHGARGEAAPRGRRASR